MGWIFGFLGARNDDACKHILVRPRGMITPIDISEGISNRSQEPLGPSGSMDNENGKDEEGDDEEIEEEAKEDIDNESLDAYTCKVC